MKVAVISCLKYMDCWLPFMALFRRFWPDCPYPMTFATDALDPKWSWCEVVSWFALGEHEEPVLIMQEDFFLNAPVRQDLIDHALQQMKERNAGMVRLYPCPGADEEYGDPHYGLVKKGTPYRISCQASIWRADYLHAIASRCGSTPQDFEITGTKIANDLPDEVLAFKRDSGPWPMEYLCSGITRGKWNPDAKLLFEKHGIEADFSLRPTG